MTFKLLSWQETERWNAFVAAHPLGTIYHTTRWARVVRQSYGGEPLYLYGEDEQGAVRSALPLFLIRGAAGAWLCSVPCAQSCNPLAPDQSGCDELVGRAFSLAGQHLCSSLELRTDQRFPFSVQGFNPVRDRYLTYLLNLRPDLEAIWRGLHQSVRRALKSAHGLALEVDRSEAAVQRFYRMYLAMRRSKGLLPQPLRFFRHLWSCLDGRAEILHARREGRLISSVFLLKYGDTVSYEYGGTIPRDLRYHPSQYLLWEAIRRAKADGYRVFDFGRTSAENTGLATFKQHWGTQANPLIYYSSGEEVRIRGREGLKAAMSLVVRHSPAWLSRIGGRLLYRYLV